MIKHYLEQSANRQAVCDTGITMPLIMMLIAILPSITGLIYTGQKLWLCIALLSASLYCVQKKIDWPLTPVFAHSLFIVGCIICLYLTKNQLWLFSGIAAIIAASTMALTCYNAKFRTLSSWTIIPAVYIACELTPAEVNHLHLWKVITYLAIGLSGHLFIMLARWYLEEKKQFTRHLLWPSDILQGKNAQSGALFFAATLFITVFIASVVAQQLPFSHKEWLIWSSVSVSTGEISSMVKKFRTRLSMGLTGLLIGYLLLILFPSLSKIGSFLPLLIPFTLVLPNYSLAFCCRNLLIALSAADANNAFRISDVFLGGLIGMICGYIALSLYNQFFLFKKQH